MEFFPFYLALVSLFGIGIADASFGTEVHKKLYFWLTLLLLVALAGFRSIGTGSDDESYIEIFSRIPKIIECRDILCGYNYSELNIEFGFFSLISIFSLFGTNHFFLFSLVAFFAIYCNLQAMRFFSPYFGASVLIYFSHLFFAKELNAIRLGLATAVAFYAVTYLYKKIYVIFLVLMLFAVSIHISVILVFIPALLWLISPRRLYIFYGAICVILINLFYNLAQVVTSFLNVGFLAEKLQQYSNAAEYNYAISLFDAVNVRNILLVALFLLFWEKFCTLNDKLRFGFYFFFCATFFRILFGDFAIIAGRGYGAISMFEIILIPSVIILLAGQRLGYFLTFIYAVITLYLNLHVNTGWSGGRPYFDNFL